MIVKSPYIFVTLVLSKHIKEFWNPSFSLNIEIPCFNHFEIGYIVLMNIRFRVLWEFSISLMRLNSLGSWAFAAGRCGRSDAKLYMLGDRFVIALLAAPYDG